MNGYQIGTREAIAEQLVKDARWTARRFLAKLPEFVSAKLDYEDMASEAMMKTLQYPPPEGVERSRSLTIQMMVGAMAASIGLRKVRGKTIYPALPFSLEGMREETEESERQHYEYLALESLRRPEPDEALLKESEKAMFVEKLKLLHDAINRLPMEYQEVLHLRWGVDGIILPYKAMGEILGQSHQTCINREQRALKILMRDGIIPDQILENPKLGIRWYAALRSAAGIEHDNNTNVVLIRPDRGHSNDGVENAEEEQAA